MVGIISFLCNCCPKYPCAVSNRREDYYQVRKRDHPPTFSTSNYLYNTIRYLFPASIGKGGKERKKETPRNRKGKERLEKQVKKGERAMNDIFPFTSPYLPPSHTPSHPITHVWGRVAKTSEGWNKSNKNCFWGKINSLNYISFFVLRQSLNLNIKQKMKIHVACSWKLS